MKIISSEFAHGRQQALIRRSVYNPCASATSCQGNKKAPVCGGLFIRKKVQSFNGIISICSLSARNTRNNTPFKEIIVVFKG